MSDNALPGEATRQVAILEAVDAIASKEETDAADGNLITLSTKVVLEVYNTLSLSRLQDVESQIMFPPVPKIYVKDQDREIENPADPIYKAAYREVEIRRGFAVLDSASALCTRPFTIPDNMCGPESQEWADMLEELGYHPKTSVGRYMLWIRLYAGPGPKDMENIMSRVTRGIGIREEDVLVALDKFPDNREGGKDQSGETEGRDS